MKKSFRMLAVVICFVMLFLCIQPISNADTASTMNTNILSSSCSFTLSGINSTSSAKLTARTSMALNIKMELQKLKSGSYTTIETWTVSKTGTSLLMEETRLINVLSTYRLKVTFTAGSETLIRYAYP